MGQHDDRSQGLVDAEQFLRVSEALKRGFAEISTADLPAVARDRWQRRLIAITNLAKHDLDRAERQVHAFLADLEGELGGARAGRGRPAGDDAPG